MRDRPSQPDCGQMATERLNKIFFHIKCPEKIFWEKNGDHIAFQKVAFGELESRVKRLEETVNKIIDLIQPQ